MAVGGGGFPGASLLTQLFRQLTKPLSKRLVEYASQRPVFRRYFLLAPGRLYHRLEWSARLLMSPKDVAKQIVAFKLPPIKEEDAIELGSQIMIEVVIFLLLVLLMVMDYVRSQIKSARKEQAIQAEIDELEERKASIMRKIEEQLAKQKELRDELAALERERSFYHQIDERMEAAIANLDNLSDGSGSGARPDSSDDSTRWPSDRREDERNL
ncbi:hypothetical protein TKK_0011464 [Trichogramma kaykai]|uniref:OPA3-like protein n=1 Tax=Trichogramma kaykai TaxID=54128 RepID=A0ABD2WQX2_9HYME